MSVQPDQHGVSPSSFSITLLPSLEIKREEISALFKNSSITKKLILNELMPKESAPFRVLGFVHLLTAAGIHLYSLASVIRFVSNVGVRFFGISIYKGLQLSWALTLFFWFEAWLFTGARWGMLRPLGLVLLSHWAVVFGVRWRTGMTLFLAVAGELILQQVRALLFHQSGFHSETLARIGYSLAVAGGLLCVQHKKSSNVILLIRQHFLLAWGSWVGLALVEAVQTGMIALMTPFITLITLPWVLLFYYPLVFVASVFSGTVLSVPFLHGGVSVFSKAVEQLMASLVYLEKKTSEFGLGLWWVDRKWILYAFAFSCFVWLVKKNICRKKIAIFFAFLMVLLMSGRLCFFEPVQSTVARSVWQLDVGQGDAALFDFGAGHGGMVDVGPDRSLSPEAWLKVFSERGIRELDWVLLSHLDADHWGALEKLISLIPIHCIALAYEIPNHCVLPASVRLMNLSVAAHSQKGNEKMGGVVVQLERSKTDRYWMGLGDASVAQEKMAISWLKNEGYLDHKKLNGHWLFKAGHHGSKFSNSTELLSVFPLDSEVWVSVGSNNRYGHPHREALQRIENFKLRLIRSDFSGVMKDRFNDFLR